MPKITLKFLFLVQRAMMEKYIVFFAYSNIDSCIRLAWECIEKKFRHLYHVECMMLVFKVKRRFLSTFVLESTWLKFLHLEFWGLNPYSKESNLKNLIKN